MGASEYLSNVQLGLWCGTLKQTASRPARTFYYGWCEANNPAYDDTNCFSLLLARIGVCLGICLMVAGVVVIALLSTYVIKLRLEPTMARVAAVFAGRWAGCVPCGWLEKCLFTLRTAHSSGCWFNAPSWHAYTHHAHT